VDAERDGEILEAESVAVIDSDADVADDDIVTVGLNERVPDSVADFCRVGDEVPVRGGERVKDNDRHAVSERVEVRRSGSVWVCDAECVAPIVIESVGDIAADVLLIDIMAVGVLIVYDVRLRLIVSDDAGESDSDVVMASVVVREDDRLLLLGLSVCEVASEVVSDRFVLVKETSTENEEVAENVKKVTEVRSDGDIVSVGLARKFRV
jgi:hypothetical protein